jgi:predicted GNAT superfamily acetyltransferase
MQDFAACVELQEVVWQMQRQDAVSPYIMNAMCHNGGAIIAAEAEGQMVGFCLGFAGKRGDDILLWSHMAGVHPAYQGQGIGFKVKQAQRTWALENGYTVIGWTFDPLQRGNANFNFNHLGAIARTYHVNHYGEMTDSINVGLASDRLEAWWQLNDSHVKALASGQPPAASDDDFPDEAFFVRTDTEGRVIHHRPARLSRPVYCIEIPYDVGALKRENMDKAIQWQSAIRESMLRLFAEGYIAHEVVQRHQRCWYVLSES